MALAVAVLVVDVGGALITAHQRGQPRLSSLGVAYLVAGAVPLIWRRRWPVAVLALVGCATAAFGIAELPDPPVHAALLIALFTVAAHETRRVTVAVGLVAAAAALASVVLAGDSGLDDYYSAFLPGALAVVLGDRQRTHAAYLAEVEARARALELDQQAASERAVSAERARIARELHDVVAHHVSMIVVQAEAGAAACATASETGPSSPAAVSSRFDGIAATGRSAMTELRRLLGVLREPDHQPTTAPQPGLGQVEALVAQVREAGVPVILTVEGDPRPLPDGVDVSAYRIVQEALTNVVRHAGSAPTRVLVRYGTDAVDICVEDEGTTGDTSPGRVRGRLGPETGATAPGHGLVGIRERAALLNGELRIGPRPQGGFEVAARLPVDAARGEG